MHVWSFPYSVFVLEHMAKPVNNHSNDLVALFTTVGGVWGCSTHVHHISFIFYKFFDLLELLRVFESCAHSTVAKNNFSWMSYVRSHDFTA